MTVYITYLTNQNQTNAHHTSAGAGTSREASEKAATYYNNQLPYVRTVPKSKAPKWAIQEARQQALDNLTNLQSVLEFGKLNEASKVQGLDQVAILEELGMDAVESRFIEQIKKYL